MIFLRSLSGVTLRDRIKGEKIRKQWKVEEIIDDIQNYKQKWNQHVLRIRENRLPRKSLLYQPTRQKRFRKTLSSLKRPVHVVAERELITQNCEWKKKKKKKKLSISKVLNIQFRRI
jgi:hypothetical protein